MHRVQVELLTCSTHLKGLHHKVYIAKAPSLHGIHLCAGCHEFLYHGDVLQAAGLITADQVSVVPNLIDPEQGWGSHGSLQSHEKGT